VALVWSTNHGYRATVRGDYLGAQVINRYDFNCTAVANAAASPSDFVLAFKTAIIDAALKVQSSLYNLNDVLIQNLGATAQGTFQVATPDTGDISSTTYPAGAAALCFTFRITPNLGISRSGWKRLAGVPAQCILGNDVVDVPTGLLTNLEDFATALTTPFTTTAGNTFKLGVVTHGFPDGTNIYPSVSASYVGLGTQNTRKPNRGA